MNLEIRNGIRQKRDAIKNGIQEFKNHMPSVKKKLAISGVLTAGFFSLNWLAAPVFAINHPDLIPNDWNEAFTLGLSYVFNILAGLINLYKQEKLLENSKIDMSGDVFQTGIFHGLGKFNKLKEERRKRSIASVIVPSTPQWLTSFVKEGAILSVGTKIAGIDGVALLKVTQGGISLLQIAGAQIALETIGRKEKFNNYNQELLSKNGFQTCPIGPGVFVCNYTDELLKINGINKLKIARNGVVFEAK